ncbi:MAG TPA: DUF1634 domain-containing protein [Tepidisphaeraceae bacterium]|nr:DUF1634 domain-containing protein [Tepidisphaeraceae bacterium]
MELLISTVLRTGVVTSLSIVVLGTILSFIHHPEYLSSPPTLDRLTRPGAAFPHTLTDVAAGVVALRGQSIVAVGLLLLIATPVLRVAVSTLIFLHERDRVFTLITLLVLGLLLLSFGLGKSGG